MRSSSMVPSAVSAAHAIRHSTSDGSLGSSACGILTLRLPVWQLQHLLVKLAAGCAAVTHDREANTATAPLGDREGKAGVNAAKWTISNA